MKIYFAASIRGGREDQKWYEEVTRLLAKYGTVLTGHVSALNLTDAGEALQDFEVYQRDLSWLAEADCVVVEATMPSLGVGYEIARAEGMGRKILCIHRADGPKKLSFMISGNPAITVREYASISDLARAFSEFFSSSE